MPTRHKGQINVVNWPSIVCVFLPMTFSFFPVPTLRESRVLSPSVPWPLLIFVAGSRPYSLLMWVCWLFPGDHEHLGLLRDRFNSRPDRRPPSVCCTDKGWMTLWHSSHKQIHKVINVSVSPHKTLIVLLDTLSSLPWYCSLVANCRRGCCSHTGPKCHLSLASPFFSSICSRSVLSRWVLKAVSERIPLP